MSPRCTQPTTFESVGRERVLRTDSRHRKRGAHPAALGFDDGECQAGGQWGQLRRNDKLPPVVVDFGISRDVATITKQCMDMVRSARELGRWQHVCDGAREINLSDSVHQSHTQTGNQAWCLGRSRAQKG